MYVDDSTYKRNGKKYRRILLRNSYRSNGKVKHDTIANLSTCSSQQIQALKFALKHKGKLEKPSLEQNIQATQGLGVGAVWLLYQLAKRVSLCKALGHTRQGKLILWLVIACVIGQGSRLSAVRLAQRHHACDILGLDSFNEDDLYRAMDWLTLKQSQVEDKLFTGHYGNKKPSFYLYDVTSSYFEGNENELAAYGYNRDKKRGKKQIVIGLMTDEKGRPITIEVFQGNTQDPQTVSNQIKKIAQRFGVTSVTLVGDRGMLKSAQIEALNSEGLHYITAITKPQIESLIKKDVMQFSLFEQEVVEITDEGTRYVLRRNPIRQAEINASRQSKLHHIETLVEQKNIYLKEHPKAKESVALRGINAQIKKLKLEQWLQVTIEAKRLNLTIDEQEKEKCTYLDGCYVIKTDLDAEAISTKAIHARYKDLASVESAFRTLKTTMLEMRAIYVRKENRTRAHVLICMLAYLLVFELQHKWREVEMTVAEGIDALAAHCSLTIQSSSRCPYQIIPKPNVQGQLLLDKAEITLPDAIAYREVNVATRKKLVSERI